MTPHVPAYQRTPDHGEKEAYTAPKIYYQPKVEQTAISSYQDPREAPIPVGETRSRKYPFGWSRKKFLIACIVLAVLITALAIGIGVGVGVSANKHNGNSTSTSTQDSNYKIGGALNPAYFSKQGAFNGSGVALADVNFSHDKSRYVFYQKYTGEVQQVIYESDGSWNFVTQVASDAKNSTPLSTVAYIIDSVATWHLFYVSKDNILKQRVQNNASQYQTNIWEDGPLNQLNLSVYDGDSVGVQACYWGNFYGSLQDYNNAGFQPSNSTATTGMNM